jgi:dTDP-4-dehydrorhamnose reductase
MIVVTGCQGQLGTELCRQLGPEAVGLDLPEFDLTRPDAVRSQLAAIRPTAVINTAAYTLVDRAEQESEVCRAVNATGVGYLADVCRELDATLLQVSTDYVFGGDTQRSRPFGEDDEPAPQGVYARMKLAGEHQACRWTKHFIVRTCGLYGRPGPRSVGNFVATILRLGRERAKTPPARPLTVVSDQRCTPSYVPHVARAIRFLLETDAYGIYHVVNAGETTWYEMAIEILRQAKLDVPVEPITSAHWGALAPRPAYSVLDTHKYLALAGRPEMPTWQAALGEYLEAIGS